MEGKVKGPHEEKACPDGQTGTRKKNQRARDPLGKGKCCEICKGRGEGGFASDGKEK